MVLDPRTHAIRPDLADVRLAEFVFAPHYAAPVVRRLKDRTPLLAARDSASEVLATLAPGDVFEVLEFAGPLAWGTAPAAGMVGYLASEALDLPS